MKASDFNESHQIKRAAGDMLWRKVRASAALRGVSLASWVQDALREKLSREEKTR